MLKGLSHCEFYVRIFGHVRSTREATNIESVQIFVKITFAGTIRIVQKRYEIIRNPTTLATIDVLQAFMCDTVRFIS